MPRIIVRAAGSAQAAPGRSRHSNRGRLREMATAGRRRHLSYRHLRKKSSTSGRRPTGSPRASSIGCPPSSRSAYCSWQGPQSTRPPSRGRRRRRRPRRLAATWLTRNTDHFEIYYAPAFDLHGERVGREAERAYEQATIGPVHVTCPLRLKRAYASPGSSRRTASSVSASSALLSVRQRSIRGNRTATPDRCRGDRAIPSNPSSKTWTGST